MFRQISRENWQPIDTCFVRSAASAVAVATGNEYTCALLSSFYVTCWGFNDYGQLGMWNLSDVLVPTVVDLENGLAQEKFCRAQILD